MPRFSLHRVGSRRHIAHLAAVLSTLALTACGAPANTESAAAGPDALLGVWVPNAAPERLLTAAGEPPPLNAEAAEIHAARLKRLAAGDSSFDQTTWCASPGIPRILTMPYPFEIRRDGDFLAFVHGWYRWHRVVNLAGVEVVPPFPLTMGFPVGHWEDDTLVIRTVGLSDVAVLDASGLPRSEEMVLTERLRVLPDGRLEDRITIDDAETFTQPWETVLYFRRDASLRVTDDVCPDRIANGEPAVRKELPPATTASTAPVRAAAPAVDAAGALRIGGIWEPRTFGFLVPEAPLSAAGEAFVDRNAAAMSAGSIMQTAWTSCRPGAVSTMTMPREKIVVLQSPEELTILYEMPRMARRVRMNGAHPESLQPSYVGDSVGHWEGDTLVIDTIGFNGYSELDARGQPTSPALHTVERLTPAVDGSGIEIEVTITDPEYYEAPFTIKRAWNRSAATHPLEYDCSENPRAEDFENAYYVRDRYRPTCMRVKGEGAALSRVVCRTPDQ
jgi:hypothetical protein